MIFSKSLKTLALIRTLHESFSTLDNLLFLHVTLGRSILEYASYFWNNITTIDDNKLERIQRKFASLCFKHLFSSSLLQLCLLTENFSYIL